MKKIASTDESRRELANAIRALIGDLGSGGTLALPDAIGRVYEAADECLTRRTYTETRGDGSTATVREYVFDRSFLNGDGDIVHEPVCAATVKYPNGRVSTSSRNGSPSRLRPVDREAADVLKVEAICTQLQMDGAPDDAVEQLTALADRIAPPEGEGATAGAGDGAPRYVTLDQAAAQVGRRKSALRHYKGKGLPDPDVKGRGGQADEWLWSTIRPWLMETFSRQLPEQLPPDPFRAGAGRR